MWLLETKTALKVVSNILEVFTTVVFLSIFQSDSGKEFVNKIINKVTNLEDGIKIVDKKLCYF